MKSFNELKIGDTVYYCIINPETIEDLVDKSYMKPIETKVTNIEKINEGTKVTFECDLLNKDYENISMPKENHIFIYDYGTIILLNTSKENILEYMKEIIKDIIKDNEHGSS